jgi:hypothetical protein
MNDCAHVWTTVLRDADPSDIRQAYRSGRLALFMKSPTEAPGPYGDTESNTLSMVNDCLRLFFDCEPRIHFC